MLDRVFGAEEPWDYHSTTTRDEPPPARYRFIRQIAGASDHTGIASVGPEPLALELRLPARLVREASMPEETRAAVQAACGELFDQARTTLRSRAY